MALTTKLAKEMSISHDGDTLLLVTDFTFEVNKETIDVTTLDDAGWRSFLVDLKDWKISGSANQGKGTAGASEAGWDELMVDLKADTAAVAVVFTSTDVDDFLETGTGFLTSLSASGSVGDKITYSFEIQGTGAIVTTTVTT